MSSSTSFGKLQDNAQRSFRLFISIAVGLALLLLVISCVIARAVTLPLRRMMADVFLLSQGNVATQFDTTRRDEIGQLAVALEGLATSLRDKVHVAENIAGSNLSTEVILASGQDSLGKALQAIVHNLPQVP